MAWKSVFECIDVLFENTDDIKIVFNIACRTGFVELVDLLLQMDLFDPSTNDNFALYWACYHTNVDVIHRLLQDPRINPMAKNNYALISAFNNGFVTIVDALLRHPRIDFLTLRCFMIEQASITTYGNVEILDRILQESHMLDSRVISHGIKNACGRGKINILDRLLQCGGITEVNLIYCTTLSIRYNIIRTKTTQYDEIYDLLTKQYPHITLLNCCSST